MSRSMAEWGKQPGLKQLGPRPMTEKESVAAIAKKIEGREHGNSYTTTSTGVGATYKTGVHTGVSYTGQKGGKPTAKKPAAKKPAAKKPAAKKPAAKKTVKK
jgi:sec-independent protein translocase protein TatB